MSRSPLLRLTAAISCCLLTPAAALAADGERTPLDLTAPAGAPDPGSTGGGLVRTIVGLVIVLAVIYGLHWTLKQVKSSREERHLGAGLGTLATLPLGAKGSLHLVRAGSEVILVGLGDHGVTPIRVYAEREARALGLLDDDSDSASGPTGARMPAVMDATPPSLPKRMGDSLRRGSLRGLLEDLRARTVIK